MRKQNVFMVTGRSRSGSGELIGPVITHLFCAVDHEAMLKLVSTALPGFAITSTVSLEALDETSKKVKAVLAGTDRSWQVFVQPGMV